MARWTSFALIAATAIVAAPVGTHYLSQDKPVETRVVNTTSSEVPRAFASKSELHTAEPAKVNESEKLLALEAEAVEEANLDLAGTVCAFAAQPVDKTSHGCRPGALEGMDVMLAVLPDPVHTQMALRSIGASTASKTNSASSAGCTTGPGCHGTTSVGSQPIDGRIAVPTITCNVRLKPCPESCCFVSATRIRRGARWPYWSSETHPPAA